MILKYYYFQNMPSYPCMGLINFASPEVAYRFSKIVLQNKPGFSVLSSNYVFDNRYKSVICFLNDVRLDSDKSTILLGLSNQNISYYFRKTRHKFLTQSKIELNDSCLDVIKEQLIQINSNFLKVLNLK